MLSRRLVLSRLGAFLGLGAFASHGIAAERNTTTVPQKNALTTPATDSVLNWSRPRLRGFAACLLVSRKALERVDEYACSDEFCEDEVAYDRYHEQAWSAFDQKCIVHNLLAFLNVPNQFDTLDLDELLSLESGDDLAGVEVSLGALDAACEFLGEEIADCGAEEWCDECQRLNGIRQSIDCGLASVVYGCNNHKIAEALWAKLGARDSSF